MARWSAGGRLAMGSTIASIGALIMVSYWIYTLQEDKAFWRLPTFLGLGLCVLGLLVTASGGRSDAASKQSVQKQTGGVGSVNIQSGRDTKIAPQPRDPDA